MILGGREERRDKDLRFTIFVCESEIKVVDSRKVNVRNARRISQTN